MNSRAVRRDTSTEALQLRKQTRRYRKLMRLDDLRYRRKLATTIQRVVAYELARYGGRRGWRRRVA